ncbi:MAG TPA: glycosyltransferase family 4 protein [Candidatus Competibacter denitrificans]|nr:hypothetical protein [Candidatus Competibacteraceae bacterium]HRC70821.1 glycosyltransferase family 4 protein [Candidatus Competibacter denitrificans]
MTVWVDLVVFATAWVLAGYLAGPASRITLLDHPNIRSLHRRPTPRTGGLAMLAAILTGGFLVGWMLPVARPGLGFLVLGLGPLAVVSLLDDRRGIRFQWRLAVHAWAAFSLVLAGYRPDWFELPGSVMPLSSGFAFLLTLLGGVWMINLYNFMDGMDGFAGGMAVIGFSALAWLGRADESFVGICLIVVAASAGFLVHNFPPAKIFMGDVGSTALGFLAAACGLWGNKIGLFPLWAALLIFSPFIVDATVTLLRRSLRGENVWEAHRTHYYQRLVLLGWGHRRTVLAEYGLMLACAGSAVWAVDWSPAGQLGLLIGWACVYVSLMWGVGRLERWRARVLAP